MHKVCIRLTRGFLASGIALTCSAAVIDPPAKAADSAAIPDLSGQWGRDMLFFEPPTSGPGPVINVHPPQTPRGSVRDPGQPGNLRAPCCAIVVEGGWAGDHTNPILKPEAAEAVRKYRELSDSGAVMPDLHNTCHPEPPPFVMSLHFGVNIVQQKDEVTLFYLLYNTVRHVRLNARHPAKIVPSWQGDSIGRYDGDALVVDTIGIKAAPPSTVDAFGTPHSEALHVVERYGLIDGKAAAEEQQKNGASYRPNPPYGRGTIDPDTTKKGLQVDFTVDDRSVFTAPWSARVTYRRLIGDWPESVCAENPHFFGSTGGAPLAEKPDF